MPKKLLLFSLLLLAVSTISSAQDTQPEMADTLRSNGKIYVVVLVLATIFAGLIVFLIRMDRKITKLERNK